MLSKVNINGNLAQEGSNEGGFTRECSETRCIRGGKRQREDAVMYQINK